MIARSADHQERRLWSTSAAVVLAAHSAAVAAVIGLQGAGEPQLPEPVMVVELPPPASSGPAAPQTTEAEPQPQPVQELPSYVPPEIDVPQVRAPMPPDPVVLPPPPKIPAPVVQARTPAARVQPAPAVAAARSPAPPAADSGSSDSAGSSPDAKKKEARYYSLLMAHLNRKKRYPSDAKKARQQGIVTVRFTVERSGRVSDASIKRSSGHDLLDSETLALMQRVSPLPPIPREMDRETITISLPIDYSLSSK